MSGASGTSGTSGVVLRCPNCGTTQAAAGECEACHEANVRHYCTNHSPGRWLDGPVCEECALRPARVAGSPRVPSPSVPPSPTRPRPGGVTEPRPPLVPRPPVSRGPVPRVPGPTVDPYPPAYDDVPARGPTGRDPAAISLEELLATLREMRTGARRGRDRDYDRDADIGRGGADWEGGGAGSPLPGGARGRGMPAAVGCLKRLLVLALVGAILFALAAAWFFSGVIVID